MKWFQALLASIPSTRGIRTEGFSAMIEFVAQKRENGGSITIVETGCMRSVDRPEHEGHSTQLFYRMAAAGGPTVAAHSIELSPQSIATARSVCGDFVVFHCGDSVRLLSELTFGIDLLYLDSMDVNWDEPHEAALHCMFELAAARHLLSRGSAVFADDFIIHPVTGRPTGKPLYLREHMRRIGAKPLTSENSYIQGWQLL